MLRSKLELTKYYDDWVLSTAHVVVRFTKDAVVFTNVNGSLMLTATPKGAETKPSADLAHYAVVYPDGGGWWTDIKQSSFRLWVNHQDHRDGFPYYEISGAIETHNVGYLGFSLRLTLNAEGSVAGFFVSDAVMFNDFLHRFLTDLLVKHHKTGEGNPAEG
jgi:hypothetical protein